MKKNVLCGMLLCCLGILYSYGKTYILPPEALKDMGTLSAEKFKATWPHYEIPDSLTPVEEGLFVKYRHENLTYYFGVYTNQENAQLAQTTMQGFRNELIALDPKFASSEVSLVAIGGDGAEASQEPASSPSETDNASGPETEEQPQEEQQQQATEKENPSEKNPSKEKTPSNTPSSSSENPPSQTTSSEEETTEASEQTEEGSGGTGNGKGLTPPTTEELESVPLAWPPVLKTSLPRSVDLSSKVPEPGNQGKQNSCVGWALAYATKSYQEEIETPTRKSWFFGSNKQRFSPAFVYNQINGGADQGAKIIDGMKLLQEAGAVTWEKMPYKSSDAFSQPSPNTIKQASPYRIDAYRRLRLEDVKEIKGHLAAGFPVVIGAMVEPEFERLPSGSVWRNTTGRSTGGHAMTLIGYDSRKRAFKVMNSWGTRWADGGFGWMDEALTLQVTQEAYVLKDGDNDWYNKKDRSSHPPSISLEKHTLEARHPSHGIGISFEGSLKVPEGYSGTAQVAVYFITPPTSPVLAADNQFANVLGHAVALSDSFTLAPGQEQTWNAFIPYYAFALTSGKRDVQTLAVLYVDQYGLTESTPHKVTISK